MGHDSLCNGNIFPLAPQERIYGGRNVCPMSIFLSLVNGLQFDPPDLPHIAVPISGMLSSRDEG
jgi:hypothetical protein